VKTKLDEIIRKLPTSKLYSNIVSKALEHTLEFELGFDHALEQFKEKGDFVDIHETYAKAMKNRFAELLFLEHLVMGSGFSYFRDEILNLHIQKLFGKKE